MHGFCAYALRTYRFNIQTNAYSRVEYKYRTPLGLEITPSAAAQRHRQHRCLLRHYSSRIPESSTHHEDRHGGFLRRLRVAGRRAGGGRRRAAALSPAESAATASESTTRSVPSAAAVPSSHLDLCAALYERRE